MSQASSSSSWKASYSSSVINPCASSNVCRKLVSVFSIEVMIRSTSLVFIRRASSAVAEGMAFSLSRALVIAPEQPPLDLLTATKSAGGLLLEDMALKE